MSGPLLLGVRHHGPGSARAVRTALAAYAPRVLLVEGPPEADEVVALAKEPAGGAPGEGMRPPVALLAHVRDEPGRAAFWPLAAFSPEWVAIRWALEHDVPVRFIDLPAAHTLALPAEDPGSPGRPSAPEPAGPGGTAPEDTAPHGGVPDAAVAPEGPPVPETDAPGAPPSGGAELRLDPLAALAAAAGYDDPERWWEDAVEHRAAGGAPASGGTGERPVPADPFAPFAALGEAMAALRERHGDGGHRRDLLREAHMRLRLHEARREYGPDGVAVVCGAWHVPALARKAAVTADRRLLRGLPRARVEVTWVPWTHRRLARRSGYGAGIDSPGWYGHLFAAPDRPVERWLTRIAGLLREEGRVVSTAHVIEAVRLAGSLAALRGRPLAGLGETLDAARAVLCEGSEVPLALIRERLVVGDALGRVPEGAPAVPLQRDLARLQRSLRLRPEARERELELDLRRDTDAARSRLLHRLRLLGVEWGVPAGPRTGSTGTFRESWRLRWEPELSVRLAEAGVWGTTVLAAATARATAEAGSSAELGGITALAERCLLAELPEALPVVMRALADRAALDSDVGRLAQALPALVRALRYGDVRGTDAGALAEVARGLAERVRVGLPPACAGLDAEGAAELRDHVDTAHRAVTLLAREGAEGREAPPPAGDPAPATGRSPRDDPGAGRRPVPQEQPDGRRGDDGLLDRWHGTLRTLAARDRVPGLIRGRCARLLLDDGRLPDDEAARLMGHALSPGTPPADAAAWAEGFLAGGGMLLVHDERLLALVDAWLAGVPQEAFTDVLPLLRRTFAAYEAGVRRTLGELVRRGPAGGARVAPGAAEGLPGFGPGLDEERADAVLPVLRLLLSGGPGGREPGGPGAAAPGSGGHGGRTGRAA
ncbi:DUF5682 family protein [Streptomyces sp. JJ36]|uniref:DUF5682 family protein n=1 Tax=Streptomyces sp. JJ36 TaxID=2736645 RepID=UPI0027E426EB|nr:DUF5682 family protein [Streptomyces sp. JJ36]